LEPFLAKTAPITYFYFLFFIQYISLLSKHIID